MKLNNLILAVFLSVTFSYAKEKVDCSDPKNRPRDIGGRLIGGG
nr:hypothetical protein [uncultured Campylobacter sp.]